MKRLFVLLAVLISLNACATKTTKFQKKVENCKEIYGYFTKSLDCLGLNFDNLYSKKNQEYEKQHDVLILALADQVYKNKISNEQVWDIYDEFLIGFRESKNKSNYLTNAIFRTK
ncbi:hypothetical protein N9U84_01980 [Candidatus Pelagibacter sp.]|nr:hypothetical protein [Candidatus Pelagibacter sp.]